jgi:hypothetical protein
MPSFCILKLKSSLKSDNFPTGSKLSLRFCIGARISVKAAGRSNLKFGNLTLRLIAEILLAPIKFAMYDAPALKSGSKFGIASPGHANFFKQANAFAGMKL